ncbi:NAD(P)-dependent oxidoreductase [Deinococcus sonorensis]|uniref:NAD(P)-dependent oxidoreductase n=2 Tax=Deinococcus sonorensis TaxID=309891 RepID=A0AAU7U4Z4_9DEIO
MRVLILGASGFLGGHVQAALSAAGHQVVNAPPSSQLDLAGGCEALLRGTRPDAVVNCAGRTQGTDAELTLANLTLVQQLIRAALTVEPHPRVVQLGSAAEYGPLAQVVSEDTPPQPDSAYGQSKLAATRALLAAAPELDVTVLRVCNPVGAGQRPQTLPGRAARLFQQALREHAPEVEFGDLSARRDFIDARDVARAVELVLRAPPAEPLLNVGRGEAVPARTLVRALARLCRYPGQIHEHAAGSSRSGALLWQRADVSRLRGLGWAPSYSLQDALDALWRDVEAHTAPRRTLA